ncbi:MAG TPA: type II secretion system protein N [Desulfurivibrionaceae bacterium]|nr:type II secretion system protein N [Desulfurivibrionaceae bacterium]
MNLRPLPLLFCAFASIAWSPFAAPDQKAEVLLIRPEKLQRQEATGAVPERDPFNWSREQINRFKDQEPKLRSSTVAGLTLSGIIWDRKKPLAIINDRVVSVGDTVKGSVILEILKDMVVFEQEGIYHTLWLQPSAAPIQPPAKGKSR